MKIGIGSTLFKKAARFFPRPEDALVEVVQNAYRSYWPINPDGPKPVINLRVDGKSLIVEDTGCGIPDPTILLTPWGSKWADDVEGDQDPAGLGVFGVLAHCKSVTWESAFGTLTVEYGRLTEPGYVESLEPDVTAVRSIGTKVTMVEPNFDLSFTNLYKYTCDYTLVDVMFQGRRMFRGIEGAKIPIPGTQSFVHTKFDDPSHYWLREAKRHLQNLTVVLWHGHAILAELPSDFEYVGKFRHRPGIGLLIEIRDEHLVTPRLPDRSELIYDERTVATLKKAWLAAVTLYDEMLQLRLTVEPKNLDAYQRYAKYDPVGVEGFASEYRKVCKFHRVKTLAHRDDYSNRNRVEKVLWPKAATKFYDLNEIERENGETPDISLLAFGDGTEDPLAALGYFPSDGDESTHVLIIDEVGNMSMRDIETGVVEKVLDEPVFFMSTYDFDCPHSCVKNLELYGLDIDDAIDVMEEWYEDQSTWEDCESADESLHDWRTDVRSAAAARDGKLYLSHKIDYIVSEISGCRRPFTIDPVAKTITYDDTVKSYT